MPPQGDEAFRKQLAASDLSPRDADALFVTVARHHGASPIGRNHLASYLRSAGVKPNEDNLRAMSWVAAAAYRNASLTATEGLDLPSPEADVCTGGPSEEPAGLMLADIYEDAPVPYIHFRNNAYRLLKNGQSDRKVPISPALIRLGFLDHVPDGETAASHEEEPGLDLLLPPVTALGDLLPELPVMPLRLRPAKWQKSARSGGGRVK